MGSCNIDLQAEPFKVIDAFFEEYGNCVINGCGVLDWEDGTYHVEPGLVGLQGTDPEGNRTYKVAPFAGVTAVSLPAYMVLRLMWRSGNMWMRKCTRFTTNTGRNWCRRDRRMSRTWKSLLPGLLAFWM